MTQKNRSALRMALRSGSTVRASDGQIDSVVSTDQAVAVVEAKMGPLTAGNNGKGKITISAIRFFPMRVILEAVATEFGVTVKWLCRPVNRNEWPSRVALFLSMFDGEGAGLSRVADCLGIKAGAAGKKFVSQAEVVDRIYQAVKAELRVHAQRIDQIEKIRRALYGLSDPKAPLPLTIRGLITPRDAGSSAAARKVLPKVAPASTSAPQVGRHEPDDHESDTEEDGIEPELEEQPQWPDESEQNGDEDD